MSNSDVLHSLRIKLVHDEVFAAFNNILARIRNEFNYAETNRELETIHKRRAARDLYLEPSIPKSDRLAQANMQQIADRARVVEIGLPYRRWHKKTSRSIRQITKYLMIEREELFIDVRHKTTREDIIECFLREAYELDGELEAVIETIDQITTDIDKASYNLRDTVDLTDIVHRNLGIGRPRQ